MVAQRIQQQFFDAADLLYQAAEPLTKPIGDAVAAVVDCITGGGKVMACGDAASSHLAHHLVSRLVGQHERDRPGLAALWLDGQAHSVAQAGLPPADVLVRQVSTLGQPGDILVVMTAGAVSAQAELVAAVHAAHAREMTVVAFTGGTTMAAQEPLLETDVQLAIAAQRSARVQELHLLMSHCLCDAIDLQLLGEQEDT